MDAFNEVHRSNMSKLGEDGQPIRREGDGKVMKGPNYFKPDMTQFIEGKKKAA
jgi:predicted HAD superfamily Cof-like phosphohydrolase